MNWREAWERKYRERHGKPEPEDWGTVAEDYSQWNKSIDYEYGKRAVEALQEVIKPDFEGLDIGAGPGTITIPLAKRMRMVTAIEPTQEMVWHLMRNVVGEGIGNIEVTNKSWQEVDDASIRKRFDIVACSHLLWQFEDIDTQLKRMESTARRYCCVVHPAGGRGMIIRSLWSEIMGKEYRGEIDPDLDDIVFAILRERGILVNVRVINYTDRRSVEQEERHIASLLGRWTEITPALGKTIREAVLKESRDGMYEGKSHAVVMWWKTPNMVPLL